MCKISLPYCVKMRGTHTKKAYKAGGIIKTKLGWHSYSVTVVSGNRRFPWA